jgi:hypothetical protein
MTGGRVGATTCGVGVATTCGVGVATTCGVGVATTCGGGGATTCRGPETLARALLTITCPMSLAGVLVLGAHSVGCAVAAVGATSKLLSVMKWGRGGMQRLGSGRWPALAGKCRGHGRNWGGPLSGKNSEPAGEGGYEEPSYHCI